jgi:hypothetical protein
MAASTAAPVRRQANGKSARATNRLQRVLKAAPEALHPEILAGAEGLEPPTHGFGVRWRLYYCEFLGTAPSDISQIFTLEEARSSKQRRVLSSWVANCNTCQ